MIPLEERHLGDLDDIYYDTNILLGLHGYHAGIKSNSNVKVNKWCALIFRAGVKVHISQLTLSELFHRYFVNRAKAYCRNNRLTFLDMKEFKRNHVREYDAFITMHMEVYDEIDAILNKYGILISYPHDPMEESKNINKLIYEYAKHLHLQYPKLDIADAFHLSIANCAGVLNFMTLDHDFEGVTDLTIYTPS